MTAPTNQPVVSNITYFGPAFLLGQSTNEYQPLKVGTWNVVIPNPLLGNEAQAGYAAFTADGVTATRGFSGATAANLIGAFQAQYYQEGDPGSLYYSQTSGNAFTVPVLSQGSIYLYNSTIINVANSLTYGGTTGIQVVIASTVPAYPVGSLFQGAAVAGVTTLDVDGLFRVRVTPQGSYATLNPPLSPIAPPVFNQGVIPAGQGVLVDVLLIN